MIEETIGEKLRRLRAIKKISQEDLAELSGIKRPHISQIERGAGKTITLQTARALAKGLGVRPEIFLADDAIERFYLSEHVFEGLVKELEAKYSMFDIDNKKADPP